MYNTISPSFTRFVLVNFFLSDGDDELPQADLDIATSVEISLISHHPPRPFQLLIEDLY